jgi:hypothetical protein
MAFHTASKSGRVAPLQAGRPLIAELKAVAWSATHAEYCATVTLQLAGRAAHLAAAGLAFRHVFSWPVQFFRRTASDVGLLDTL